MSVTPPPPRGRRLLLCAFGGADLRGTWRLGRRLHVVSAFGGVTVDLTRAELAAPDPIITVLAVFGGVGIVAPAGLPVELSGLALFGGKGDRRAAARPAPGSPVVRVRALVLFGGLTVKTPRTWTWRGVLRTILRRPATAA